MPYIRGRTPIKLMDERTSFRTMRLLEESRLHATSTIKCVDTISKENIELRMGCHESMNSVDYGFCPAGR